MVGLVGCDAAIFECFKLLVTSMKEQRCQVLEHISYTYVLVWLVNILLNFKLMRLRSKLLLKVLVNKCA